MTAGYSEDIFPMRISRKRSALGGEFLDRISADVPILLFRFDHHSAVANTKALDIAGIESKLNEFTKDEIPLDNNGKLTGELKERAMYHVHGFIPVKSVEEKSDHTQRSNRKAAFSGHHSSI